MNLRSWFNLPLPGWRWLIAALVFGALVGVSVPVLAQTVTLTKYNLSPQSVDSVVFDSAGRMWAKSSSPAIVSLDPASNALTTWTHPNQDVFHTGADPVGVQPVGPDEARFVWAGGDDHVNRLDTNSGEVLSWPLPSSRTCGDFIAVDGSGNAWFGKNDSRIARLNPATNEITEWAVLVGTTCPGVIAVDGSGEVWVCEASLGKIGRLDPATNVIAEWVIEGDQFNDCHARDSAGRIWMSRSTTELLRLDPSTNELTVWTCPIGCGTVRGVSEESGGEVWFTEYSPARTASLDPLTGIFVEYPTSCGSYGTPFVHPSGEIWLTYYSSVCRFQPPE